MKKSNFIWIAVLLVSLLLSVYGCGGKKELKSETVTVASTGSSEENASEPELPEEGVKEVGSDVTQAQESGDNSSAAASGTPVVPVQEPVEAAAEEESTEPASSTAPNTTAPAAGDSQTAQNYRVVSLKDLKAYPEDMKIKVGTTVEWRNVNDNLQHIIGWNGQKQMGVKPEPIKMGESWSYTFSKTGTIKWFSTARPTIQGTITIEE